jgi:hypothetical protein
MSWGAQSRSKDAKTPSTPRGRSEKPEPDCRPVQPYAVLIHCTHTTTLIHCTHTTRVPYSDCTHVLHSYYRTHTVRFTHLTHRTHTVHCTRTAVAYASFFPFSSPPSNPLFCLLPYGSKCPCWNAWQPL